MPKGKKAGKGLTNKPQGAGITSPKGKMWYESLEPGVRKTPQKKD